MYCGMRALDSLSVDSLPTVHLCETCVNMFHLLAYLLLAKLTSG